MAKLRSWLDNRQNLRGLALTLALILVLSLVVNILNWTGSSLSLTGSALGARGVPQDPVMNTTYALECQGATPIQAYFTDMWGIGSENEIVEQKVIDDRGQELVRKIPGRLRWTPVTLRRGLTQDTSVSTWRTLVETGKVAESRANCTLTMFAQDMTPLVSWDLENAWPSKLVVPAPDDTTEGVAIEELVIVHEGMHRR